MRTKSLKAIGKQRRLKVGRSKDALNPDLVNSVDLLIDGPFIESELDTDRLLLGSMNKNLTFITDRYESEADCFNNPVSIEEITAEDYIFINVDNNCEEWLRE